MKVPISGLLAIAAFAVSYLFSAAQALAQNAYITNHNSNTVSVINTRTNTVIATIPVGTNPFGVAVAPDGSKVYITNSGSNTVSVIDGRRNTVTTTITVGPFPEGVAVAPDGSHVYVTHFNFVSVIDTATNRVTATITPVEAFGVAVSPDSSKVYVVGGATPGTLSVIDTATNTVTDTIVLQAHDTGGVAVSPDGSKVYAQAQIGPVNVIDTATNTVVATLDGSEGANDLAVSPDGSKLYVTDGMAVWVIDPAANTKTFIIDGGPFDGIAVTRDGSKVYAAEFFHGTVSVIDTATNTVTATVPVGSDPLAFGNFIQPELRFAGTPGFSNCIGVSVAALVREFGGLNAAAAALGFPNVPALQNAVMGFCERTS